MDIPFRILVVDDDPDVVFFLEAALSKKYEVVTALLGREALIKCQECEPDLIILDIMMPDLSGFEICRAIRKMPGKENLPIIILSALTSAEDHKTGYREGATYYLTKPIPPERLLRNIEVQLASAAAPHTKKLSMAQIHSKKFLPEPDGKADTKSTTSKPVPKPVSPEHVRPRILVVDDDPDILHMMDLLFSKDYELLISTDGLDALRKAASCDPDLLILDIIIPKVNGIQVCTSIRKLERLTMLPIIFLTGKDDPKLREMGKRFNALYLIKPISGRVLSEKVKEMINQSPYLNLPKRYSYAEILAGDSTGKQPKTPLG